MDINNYFKVKYAGTGFYIESTLNVGEIIFDDKTMDNVYENYMGELSSKHVKYGNNKFMYPVLFKSKKLAELFVNNEFIPRILTKMFSKNLSAQDLLISKIVGADDIL